MWKLTSVLVAGIVVYCIYQEIKYELAAIQLEVNSMKYTADSAFKELNLAKKMAN